MTGTSESLKALDTDNERVRALEEKVAYLEKNITDLDAVVRDLSGQTYTLLQQVKGLLRLVEQRATDNDLAPADDKPPHY